MFQGPALPFKLHALPAFRIFQVGSGPATLPSPAREAADQPVPTTAEKG